MKQTTLIIETCAKCPFISHNKVMNILSKIKYSYKYYCNYNHKLIPDKVNILKDIWEDCELLDCKGD